MKKLNLNQMENLQGGGKGDILEDKEACEGFAIGLGGASAIIGAASWWTGAGGGAAVVVGIASFGMSLYCSTL